MSEQEKETAPPETLTVRILGIHHDMGETLVETVCSDESGTALIEGKSMSLSVVTTDPTENPETWNRQVQTADALVMVVRFMDAISMEQLKVICKNIPSDPPLPMSVFLFREEGEIDFKMSCPACGQKLWVRDTDEGKRGRCPNCKKAFRLPSQAHHAKREIGLPDAVSVSRVIRGNASSCRNALANLTGHLSGGLIASDQDYDPDILLKSTMRIDVTDTDAGDTTDGATPPG